MSKPENGQQLPAICWPVPKNNRGGEFSNLEEMLAHLEGEATGHWLIGRNGMWHGGIHITDITTPWCALSGQSMNEAVDFPVPFKGEQPVRCMADGEVVAYRINRDYLSVPWYWGDLHYSGSFVLIRHRIQPGETAESGLTFYTLYMHLAPWLAYPEQDSTAFKVADGQYLNAYVDVPRQWVVAELPPGTRVIWDKAVSADTMTGSNGRQYARVTLAEPVTGRMNLNAGDRVWTVCDKGNLVPVRDSIIRPAWWSPFLPPSRETVQFDTVVCPTPYPIKAGAPVGHLGYFQVPTDNGHEKRYQVHIECLTTDDLPRFLSNPEGVGRDTPAFARCPKDIPVYLKVADGEIHKSLVTTESETVMALSGQVVTDKEGKRYWSGGGVSRGLLAESDVQLLSRYDLAGRGFEATEDNPVSFDHLDGKRQPKGLVRTIFERFFNVADNDGKLYSKIVAFNYRLLLDQIDDAKSPRYNPELYRRAVQSPSMREHLYRLCVKHPSEWYYSSESSVWKAFFTPQLKRDAPEWYAYSMKFLTDLRWMYRVAGMVENPWHMHPLVFLDAINNIGMTLDEARVRAFMRMIRVGEGTVGEVGYETLFGKQSFIKDYHKDFSDHPNIIITRSTLKSSAAGAYQVMGYTWNDLNMLSYRKKYGIVDFSPKSQDEFCVLILKYKRKGALKLIIDGDIDGALDILSYEWASLPPARYPQPTKSKSEVMSLYNKYLLEELSGETDLHLPIGYIKQVYNGV
ncbi:glycoside hydrolase family 104 protein [Escherichia coli]|nr:glycoside hydrolase family 104 protein [Escherichia coli]